MTSGKRTRYVRDLSDEALLVMLRSYSLRLRTLVNEFWMVCQAGGLSYSEAQAVLCEISGLNGQLISLLREAERRKLRVEGAVPQAEQSRDSGWT